MKVNPKERNAIKIKIVRKTRNRTSQTHLGAIMIRPTTVTIEASNEKRRATGKGSYQIMRKVNSKFADDSI